MEKRISLQFTIIILLNTVLLGLSTSISATESIQLKQKTISSKIDAIISSSGLTSSQLGIAITRDEESNDTPLFYQKNADKKFIPASLSKIITAVSALKKFPQGYKFRTQLLADRSLIKGQALKGPLYLKGGGDPAFVSESMWFLVNEFVREGITKIQGPIIVDDTYFDSIRYSDTREDSRVDRAYDAPVGAMSFNWNSVNIFIRPGKSVGTSVKVFADPESPYIKVVNQAKTVSGNKKTIQVSRINDSSHIGDTIVISGELGITQEEMVSYKNITKPDYWSGFQLIEFLKQRGLEVVGGVKTGTTPNSATLLSEFESDPLHTAVESMMKFSNNFVAEMLTKNLSAYIGGGTGSMQGGLKAMRDLMVHQFGLEAQNFSFVNPSGLTKKNLFRPRDLLSVLNNVKKDFRIYPEFLTTLPIAGVDGTLKKRMKGMPGENHVRAKTGLLTGAMGLAGYASTPRGGGYTFVFMYNGPHKNYQKVISLFDQMASILAE